MRSTVTIYGNVQGGLIFTSGNAKTTDPDFKLGRDLLVPQYTNRIALGIEYYLSDRVELSLNYGYGAGASLRTGFTYRFHSVGLPKLK